MCGVIVARRTRSNETTRALSARDRADNEERLFSGSDRLRQSLVGGFVRPVFFASKKTQERPALQGIVIANRPTKHGIAIFQRIQDRRNGDRGSDIKSHFTAYMCQRS